MSKLMACLDSKIRVLACAVATFTAFFAAQAEDLYVSINDIHSVAGKEGGWGTYTTDDGVSHDAYTNLQQAVNAAAKNDTVWVEDGFVCDDKNGETIFNYDKGVPSYGRLYIPRVMTIRSRSGKWETGAVIRGRWQCDYDGSGTQATGPNALRGVAGPANGAKNGVSLIGFAIERCSMDGWQNGCAAYNVVLSNCMVRGCNAPYNTMTFVNLYSSIVSNCYTSGYKTLMGDSNAYDSLFVDNNVYASGAYMGNGYVLSNCTFRANRGANCVCVQSGSANPARILDCTFIENTCACINTEYGANYYMVVSNCLFTANATDIIAPRYLAGSRTNNFVCAYNCVITNNTLTKSQACLVYSGGDYYNCLIAKNAMTLDNATIRNPDAKLPLRLLNCTIYGNSAPQGFGGVRNDGPVVAINTICRENTSKAGVVDTFLATTNSCIDPTAVAGASEATFTTDPMLVNPANGVYTPSELSPCYDGGSLTAYELTPTDLVGRNRLTAEGRVGIGAYAYDPNQHNIELSVTLPKYLLAPAQVTLVANVAGMGFTPVFYWDYDGDGVTDEVTVSPINTRNFDAGTWNVHLAVSNETTGAGLSTSVAAFTITARCKRYVKLGNESAAEPYDTEDNAAAEIQTAIDYAKDGDEVIILPGVYEVASSVNVFKNIVVHGSTGNPEDVIIHQTANDKCLWVNGDDETCVHSLVLENGRNDYTFSYGGGLYLASEKGDSGHPPKAAMGVVSNVVVRGGSQTCKFSVAPGIYACGPSALVTHCIVSNCTSKSCFVDGGYFSALGLYLTGGARGENCLIVDNYSGSPYNGKESALLLTNGYCNANFQSAAYVGPDSLLRFSTIANNRASYCGGVNVQGSGRVEDCVIAGNKALCQFLKIHHAEGDRLNVWSAFPANPNHCFYAKDDTEEEKAQRWANFTNIVETEIRTAAKLGSQLTTNAVDVVDAGLGEGTVETTIDDIYRGAAKGDWRVRYTSPTLDLVPPESVSNMPAKDLRRKSRLSAEGYDLGAFECQAGGLMLLVK